MIYPRAVPSKGMLDQVLRSAYPVKSKAVSAEVKSWKGDGVNEQSPGVSQTPWPSGP